MKHVIWQPAADEVLPDAIVAYPWGASVQTGVDDAGNPITGMPEAIDVVTAIVPPWPLIHTFAGW